MFSGDVVQCQGLEDPMEGAHHPVSLLPIIGCYELHMLRASEGMERSQEPTEGVLVFLQEDPTACCAHQHLTVGPPPEHGIITVDVLLALGCCAKRHEGQTARVDHAIAVA